MAAAPPAPLTWVVGAGGLLGRHVASAMEGPLFQPPRVPWNEPALARQVLTETAASFVAAAEGRGGGWQLLWCAGAGVTSTSNDILENEVAAFTTTLEALRGVPSGAVFFASSVGGVYAGNPAPPFTEDSAPIPLAPYGVAKLRAEELLREWSSSTGTPSLVGRITNLFGPGQDLSKPQGLVSQICANHVRRSPSSIWVSLDTIRDYLYAPDAGTLVRDSMVRLRAEGGFVIKILGSGRPMSIATLIGETKRVLGRKPDLLLGGSPNARYQVRDLSVRSIRWVEVDQIAFTPFGVGVAATIADLRLRFMGSSA
ncbi:NAD-dependent epimerase/dehydratase family protein [Tessaracoccus oleiagri]|uniref:NAD-dependent epimerase/dehydratase family protein n=1 Tax=Tessaracoccus oleiagri TaxID=686624 RepID=UPI000B8652AE|nr:NAD-dependent epimerase/dehydratase family protein [Tessaracoccus oleiagri]